MINDKTTVDANEVAFYARLAELWWNLDGPFWPLHKINGIRISYIREILVREFQLDREAKQPLKGLRILDIGCGGGILSEAIAHLGAEVHGVDVVGKNIKIAQQHGENSGLDIHYEVASAEILAGRGELYDVVLNMEVVEHVAELDLFLNACMSVVRPGGLMIIATINRTLVALVSAIWLGEYVLRWLPKGTHQWLRFPTPLELENLLAPGGFDVIGRTGVMVNLFSRKFRLTRFMGVNYMLAAKKVRRPKEPQYHDPV